MELSVIILAAGKGTRMKSSTPKVLHQLAGKPLLHHVFDTAESLEPNLVKIVVGHSAEDVQNSLEETNLKWVLQEEQLGTGHAVELAMPGVPENDTVLILYGDVPLIARSTLLRLLELVSKDSMALLTVTLENPDGYGRIVRSSSGDVTSIVEQKDASEKELGIKEVNSGILAARASHLNKWLPKLSSNNAQGEFYLTDIIAMAIADGIKVNVSQPSRVEEVQGVNNRLQLSELEVYKRKLDTKQLMLDGVTLYDPDRVYIRGSLIHAQDVTIDTNVIFEGHVELANGVVIGPNCVIRNTVIGEGTRIHANSVLEDTVVGKSCEIGPFARTRPGTVLKDQCKLGNFVETKKSIIGNGSKVNHLSYIGDTSVGENANIGAGTITCNYDGANKFKTEIGNAVFVGSNSSLVAPVKIADGATVGAGSVITRDIESDQLAVARGKQRNIDGWKKPEKN